MAKELPASAAEIAGVAEAAGQLGIKREDILKFSRVMVDLGESTNMSSEEAATSLARLANITQMPMENIDKLGSTIVDLGNNLATTEGEITAMALRIAGAGAQVGLTEDQILAFSGALSSVGIEAEAGGSAFSRVMIEIANASAHGEDAIGDFAKVAGMSAKDFQKAFEEDSANAIIAFIEGLDRMSKEGENVFGVLEDLGLSEIRVRDALLRASGAGDLFRESLEIGSKAWKENNALTNEAEERYKTMASKLEMLKNTIIDAGISIGDALLPAIELITDGIKGFVEKFNGLSEDTKQFIAISAAIVSALMLIVGPILLLIGFIPQIAVGFGMLSTVLTGVGTAFSFLIGPIGLIIAAIIAIGAALVLAYKKVDWFREMVDEAWAWIKNAFFTALDYVKGVVQSATKDLIDIFNKNLSLIKKIWEENGEAILAVVKASFKNVWAHIKMILGFIKGLFEMVWPIISNVVRIAWKAITTTVKNATDLVLGIVRIVLALLRGDWKTAWTAIKDTVKNIWNNIRDFLKSVDLVQVGKDIINGLIKGLKTMGKSAVDAAKSIANNVKSAFTSFFIIKSPSRVMRDQVGVHIGTGLAAGIKKSTSTVTKSARALAAATNKKFNDAFKTAKYKFDMGKINTSGYVAALKKVRAEYAKTPAHIQKVNLAIKRANDNALKAEASALKARENLVKKINNAVLSATNSYASKIASVNKKLNNDIKKANDEYNNALKDRTKQIANQIGLFDKFEAKAVSRTDLIGNLRGQVQAMRDFSGNLAKIGKNAPKAFVDDLREMGLGSASEISAIAGMTKKQLNEYVKLWKQKQKAASTEAAKQLEGMKLQTTKKINELRAAASNELNLLRGEYIQKLRKIGDDVKKLGSFKNSGKVLGKNAVSGIINGLNSMKGPLASAAKRIANTITKTVKTTLKIKSPSRVMIALAKNVPTGVAKGIDTTLGTVRQASARLTEAMTPEAPEISMAYNTPAGTYDSLAQAVSGSVDLGNSRDDKVAEAIGRLERKLESLRIEVDKRELGRVVSDETTNSRNKAVRGRGNRRL